MPTMAEKIEIAYRKAHRILPNGEIPLLYGRYVGTCQGQDSKQNQHHT